MYCFLSIEGANLFVLECMFVESVPTFLYYRISLLKDIVASVIKVYDKLFFYFE